MVRNAIYAEKLSLFSYGGNILWKPVVLTQDSANPELAQAQDELPRRVYALERQLRAGRTNLKRSLEDFMWLRVFASRIPFSDSAVHAVVSRQDVYRLHRRFCLHRPKPFRECAELRHSITESLAYGIEPGLHFAGFVALSVAVGIVLSPLLLHVPVARIKGEVCRGGVGRI